MIKYIANIKTIEKMKNLAVLPLKGCMDPDAANYKSYYVVDDPESCE